MEVTVPSLAKINLDLRVLHRRADGFHELRTIFQTISLKDTLRIEFEPAKRPDLFVESSIQIPDNLVLRAGRLIFDELKIRAKVHIALKKKIPMGAGLGGGSSNAASVLIALPALAGRRVPVPLLMRWAERLGSDVPFFLLGGTAFALGRGTELYPLPDQPARHVLVVSTGVHVSTAQAYGQLGRGALPEAGTGGATALTSAPDFPILREFQTNSWTLDRPDLGRLALKNDFEKPVFETYPELGAVARKLRRFGARPALMTGSGSAIFGLFPSVRELTVAAGKFRAGSAIPARFITRRQYRGMWIRALGSAADTSWFAETN